MEKIMQNKIQLGIIGGSGLYDFPGLKNKETIQIKTPFGKPSSPIITGTLNGKRIAFLARHGIGHVLSPSEINFRANIYTLKQLGISQIVSVSACGSLREDFAPGEIVIPDQVYDHTQKRDRSFFGHGLVAHIGAPNPYCPNLSEKVYLSLKKTGTVTHKGGTYITIEGPRFSTIAESNVYRSWGMSIIGMTACPEVFLAREAEMCYCTMAHVTDYDVWHTSEEPVSVEMVIKILQQNTATAQNAIKFLVDMIEPDEECACHSSLRDTIMTQSALIPEDTKQKLSIIIDRYL